MHDPTNNKIQSRFGAKSTRGLLTGRFRIPNKHFGEDERHVPLEQMERFVEYDGSGVDDGSIKLNSAGKRRGYKVDVGPMWMGVRRAWLQEMTSYGGRRTREEISHCGRMLLQQVMTWLTILKEQREGKAREVHSGLRRTGLQTAQKRQRQPLQLLHPQRSQRERVQQMLTPVLERPNG